MTHTTKFDKKQITRTMTEYLVDLLETPYHDGEKSIEFSLISLLVEATGAEVFDEGVSLDGVRLGFCELMALYESLIPMAESFGITLDYSRYARRSFGMPYNMVFVPKKLLKI